MKHIRIVCMLMVLCHELMIASSLHAATEDHLVPIAKTYGIISKYDELCRQKLLPTSGEAARFLSLPGSASIETSVSIYRMEGREGSLPGNYWITVTRT